MSKIIWDFDGTIADSLPLTIDLFYRATKIEPYSKNEIEQMRNMTLKQVLAKVGIPLWRMPALLVGERTKFGKRLNEVPIFEGIDDVLQKLRALGHKNYVMSSNSQQNVSKFLKNHKIHQYFDGIHGNTGLFGKAAALRLIIKKDKLNTQNCYSIGDETRDIDAAKKVHIKSIAVNWGYNGTKILKEHEPDYFVTKPAEILKLIQ